MTRSSSTISRALLGGRGFRRRAGRSVLPDAAGAASVPFSIPLGFRVGRPFSPFSRAFSSLSAATLASSCATLSSRLTTRDRSSAAERSSRLGSAGRIVMPPWTHNPRRRGIPLSQFAAPVSPSSWPPAFENSLLALAQLEFIDRHEVVHFIGQPGTGKSHLAIALGVAAVKAGRSVYFATLADVVSSLAKAEREGTLRERLRFLCRPQLLIVDEIGYLPVIAGGGDLFFQLVDIQPPN